MISKTVEILGVTVHPYTVDELHREIKALIVNNAHELVLNVNVHCLNLAYEQSWLRDFLNSATINFCDGTGVVLGARILGKEIPQRITYADWTWQLAGFSDANEFTFFFLGAKPGIAEAAAARLQECYRGLKIVGIEHGYFDKSPNSPENQAVIRKINDVKPNILLLGFGMPLQERWLMENWDAIDANIALTGGAVFDYISGELRRAPKWVTNHGFEWLGRLVIEPKRLWRRYIVGNPLFLWRIMKHRDGRSGS
jgi:N-acetylglucosaminyldiphosphoundecaprenol N-acetyl-beta-D-mannosaminyltransferase